MHCKVSPIKSSCVTYVMTLTEKKYTVIVLSCPNWHFYKLVIYCTGNVSDNVMNVAEYSEYSALLRSQGM